MASEGLRDGDGDGQALLGKPGASAGPGTRGPQRPEERGVTAARSRDPCSPGRGMGRERPGSDSLLEPGGGRGGAVWPAGRARDAETRPDRGRAGPSARGKGKGGRRGMGAAWSRPGCCAGALGHR